jgi:hypothetical protein
VRKGSGYLLVFLLCGLTACRSHTILRSASQEHAFHQQYVNKPFYTAMVLRPYELGNAYLIDLTGDIAEAPYETPRAAIAVPLGTPVTITALDRQYIVARVHGYDRPFRLLLRTTRGTVSEIAEELRLVLSETSPLQEARPAMRPFISRQEIARGMSRRETYMSWGQPDRVISSPGASGFLEEWIYFDRRIHLFLNNGFITNWQQF